MFSSAHQIQQKELLDLTIQAYDPQDDEYAFNFAKAAVRKFVWQVKRKARIAANIPLDGFPIPSPMMLLITGDDHDAKMAFLQTFLSPFTAEQTYNMTVSELRRDNVPELWASPIVIFEEAGVCTLRDAHTLKSWISSTHRGYRPPATNGFLTVPMDSSIIGCCKGETCRLLDDPMNSWRIAPVSIDLISKLDASTLWNEVRYDDENPLAGSAVIEYVAKYCSMASPISQTIR